MDGPSANCRDGKHRACTGCPECSCHAVPPTADYRAAREALARKREQRDEEGEG
jgi:hypothetical protein